jgi:hypothetical protein
VYPNFVLKAFKWAGDKVGVLRQYIIEIKKIGFSLEGFTVDNFQVSIRDYNVFKS